MSYLRLVHLTKRYGDQLAADAVSLDIEEGEMIVLLGPSGCGKTTTLRMIAGFVEASGGEIVLQGQQIGALPPHRRAMGMVFQNYALFPHLTVARNVAFGLEMQRMPRAARESRVAEMLRLVKLEAFAHRLPRQLSGGQQQRVAIARALAIHPKVLLLDEPLSNLDAELRLDVAREIRMLQRERKLTTIMVTHDQHEAMAMADRLVVMRNGRVQQVGRQEDLYERPATPFVARFIGNSNILEGVVSERRRFALPGGGTLYLAAGVTRDGPATLALRPERITLAAADGHGLAEGAVVLSSYMGAMVEHVISLDADTQIVARAPSSGLGATQRFPAGARVSLSWPASSECVFDADERPLPQIAETQSPSATNRRIASDA
jgi:putative spermidine/putrescine transport system ATP-binding protein